MSDPTPEEKLLRLIRQGGQRSSPPAPPTASQPSPTPAAATAPQRVGPPQAPRVLRPSAPVAAPQEIARLHLVAWLLGLLALLGLGYLAVSWFAPAPPSAIPALPEAEVTIELPEPPQPAPTPQIMRPLFQPPQAAQGEGAAPAGQVPPAEVAKDWSLLGIVPDEPTQAIIGDAKTNRTYFLKVGDTLSGFHVEQILSDKVILIRDGQRVELVM